MWTLFQEITHQRRKYTSADAKPHVDADFFLFFPTFLNDHQTATARAAPSTARPGCTLAPCWASPARGTGLTMVASTARSQQLRCSGRRKPRAAAASFLQKDRRTPVAKRSVKKKGTPMIFVQTCNPDLFGGSGLRFHRVWVRMPAGQFRPSPNFLIQTFGSWLSCSRSVTYDDLASESAALRSSTPMLWIFAAMVSYGDRIPLRFFRGDI